MACLLLGFCLRVRLIPFVISLKCAGHRTRAKPNKERSSFDSALSKSVKFTIFWRLHQALASYSFLDIVEGLLLFAFQPAKQDWSSILELHFIAVCCTNIPTWLAMPRYRPSPLSLSCDSLQAQHQQTSPLPIFPPRHTSNMGILCKLGLVLQVGPNRALPPPEDIYLEKLHRRQPYLKIPDCWAYGNAVSKTK